VTETIHIATRSSELALWQARHVQAALAPRGIGAELMLFKTVGDKRLDEPLAAIGGKGLFTAELERALAAGKADCAVHSLKDLPTEQPPGLALGAILERENPRDVLVVYEMVAAATLDELPRGSRVGTSSLRRRAQLLAMRPDLEVVDLRGNVPTRLRKVAEGHVHAALLAAAGLIRLGVHGRIAQYLDPPQWLPAPGQGAIAVQIRADDDRMRAMLAPLHHEPTAVAVTAERAFLAALEGGCQVPIGAMATARGEELELHGLVADPRGRRVVRGSRRGSIHDPASLGRALGDELLARGGDAILAQLRQAEHIPAPQPE
jgi:hydroxymethylbilane synthase